MERGSTDLGSNSGTGNTAVVETAPLVLTELFTPEIHRQICDFLDERVPQMSLGLDETEFIRTYAHNVPYFVGIHRQLVDLASEIFGEPVKPSYSFLSMYRDDGICPLHIDRPQCRYTIDYLIRQTQPEPWPIRIGDPMSDDDRRLLDEAGDGHPKSQDDIDARIAAENWHEVLLEPNEAVCYSGTNSWHYRPERLRGTADLVFFHFVPVAFDGPLD